MITTESIPVFALYGEAGSFPDVVHCERIVDRAQGHGWVITPHRHSAMIQLFWIESGAAEARFDARSQYLGGGEFLFVPVQVVHGFTFAPGTEGLVLSVPVATLGRLAPGGAAPFGLDAAFAGQMRQPLARLLRALADGYAATGTYRAQMLTGLVQAVVAALAEAAPRAGRSLRPGQGGGGVAARIDALDALLVRRMGQGWRAGDYAAALRITTGQLTRICRAARGQSATAYIEAATMTEASRLLAFTRMPVADVGYRLGYGDPSYFSRRFAAVQGLRPSAYRARFAE